MNSIEAPVSVCIITYNQEKYIEKCITSLLNQKTSFNFKIIVSDDFSTDKTREIVCKFQALYPKIIKLNLQDANVGAVANLISCYNLARGKYICHVDGDDYALQGKLQTQFDLLEANTDCIMCTHDSIIVDQNNKIIRSSFNSHKKNINNLIDFIKNMPFFSHSSKMFRIEVWEKIKYQIHSESLDVELHYEMIKHGFIYHVNNALCAYRAGTGISVSNRNINPLIFSGINRLFSRMHADGIVGKKIIDKCFAQIKFNQAYQSAIYGSKTIAQKLIKESLSISFISYSQLLFFLISYFPSIMVNLSKRRARKRGYNF